MLEVLRLKSRIIRKINSDSSIEDRIHLSFDPIYRKILQGNITNMIKIKSKII